MPKNCSNSISLFTFCCPRIDLLKLSNGELSTKSLAQNMVLRLNKSLLTRILRSLVRTNSAMLLNVAKAGETPVFFCLTTEQLTHLYRRDPRAEPYFFTQVPWHFLRTFKANYLWFFIFLPVKIRYNLIDLNYIGLTLTH